MVYVKSLYVCKVRGNIDARKDVQLPARHIMSNYGAWVGCVNSMRDAA